MRLEFRLQASYYRPTPWLPNIGYKNPSCLWESESEIRPRNICPKTTHAMPSWRTVCIQKKMKIAFPSIPSWKPQISINHRRCQLHYPVISCPTDWQTWSLRHRSRTNSISTIWDYKPCHLAKPKGLHGSRDPIRILFDRYFLHTRTFK